MKLKKTTIYIDVGTGNDVEFANKLKERLRNIKGEYQVTSYSDVEVSAGFNDEEWEKYIIEAIESSDVVIPILSSSYLGCITDNIQKRFDEIASSKDKYLFPILYSPSDWSSVNWVVKSNLIPSGEKSVSEISENELNLVLNQFVKTIGNIILKHNSKDKQNENNSPGNWVKDSMVFISHDHDDADFAELLKLTLEKHGVQAWIDSERLKIGQDWREEIDQGIENSLAVIAIMTAEARKSEYVTYEWAYAWGKGIKIFPIMLKQTALHPRLESLQYLDFTNRSARPWEKLISEIQTL